MSIIYNEIKDQYNALAKAHRYLEADCGGAVELLRAAPKAVFIGCGSSFSVAASGAVTMQLRGGRPAMAVAAGDLLLHMQSYRAALEGAAIVLLSRSGETSEAVLAAQKLREMGVSFSLVAVTCVEGSTLAKLGDAAITLPWAFDESVCQTRTVTCLYYVCAYLAAALAGDQPMLSGLLAAALAGPAYMERVEGELMAIAGQDWTHAIVLGDAEIGGICEEGALAFKEICQLPSNYYHVLDVRHGPMVLIGAKTLVIAALSNPENKLEQDLILDIAKKGATVVTYSDFPHAIEGVHSIAFGEALPHPARGIPAIAVCQLVAYYKSFKTGANPDQPDGLSAWISLS